MTFDDAVAQTREWVAGEDQPAGDPAPALRSTRRHLARRNLGIAAVWVTAGLLVWESVAPFVEWTLGIYPYDTVSPLRWGTLPDAFEMVIAVAAAWLVRRPTVGAQLFVRAALLSLVLGRISIPYSELVGFYARPDNTVRVIGGLFALGLLGRDRLHPDDGPFRPIAYRRSLLIAMTVSVSTVFVGLRQTLFVLDLDYLTDGWFAFVFQLVTATALSLSVWGLYRLRGWALLLNVASSLVMLGSWVYWRIFLFIKIEHLGLSRQDSQSHTAILIQLVVVLPLVLVVLRNQFGRRGEPE